MMWEPRRKLFPFVESKGKFLHPPIHPHIYIYIITLIFSMFFNTEETDNDSQETNQYISKRTKNVTIIYIYIMFMRGKVGEDIFSVSSKSLAPSLGFFSFCLFFVFFFNKNYAKIYAMYFIPSENNYQHINVFPSKYR